MNLNSLPKIVIRPKKRVGRGIGSGKGGHTTGRGNKGQKARERIPIGFEGTKTKKSLIKRLPMWRGRGKFKPWGKRFVAVSLNKLKEWPVKTAVTVESLIKAGIIKTGEEAKIVGGEEAGKSLTIKVAISRKAAEIIKAAGGKIEA